MGYGDDDRCKDYEYTYFMIKDYVLRELIVLEGMKQLCPTLYEGNEAYDAQLRILNKIKRILND